MMVWKCIETRPQGQGQAKRVSRNPITWSVICCCFFVIISIRSTLYITWAAHDARQHPLWRCLPESLSWSCQIWHRPGFWLLSLSAAILLYLRLLEILYHHTAETQPLTVHCNVSWPFLPTIPCHRQYSSSVPSKFGEAWLWVFLLWTWDYLVPLTSQLSEG